MHRLKGLPKINLNSEPSPGYPCITEIYFYYLKGRNFRGKEILQILWFSPKSMKLMWNPVKFSEIGYPQN